MAVCENIRKIRKDRGLTQKQLGELCGINEANIRKYELGKANPKIETIQKISKALQCSPVDLMGLEYFDQMVDIEQIQKEIKQSEQLEKILSPEEYDYFMKYSVLTDSAQEKVKSYIDFLFSDTENRIDVE